MEKLKFRTLEDKSEINLMLDKIENYSGVRLPASYANRSRIVGVFLQENLVAGYMLVTNPGFRSLLFVPDQIRKSSHFFRKDQFEMMEVNGLWVGPALKSPSLQMRVWIQLIKDIFFCKKKYVLLMRDTRNKTMERFLNMANPSSLYEGPPLLMAGEETHSQIQVSYTTRWKIVLNAHKYYMELRERQRRAQEFANKQRNQPRGMKHSEPKYAG